MNGEIERLVERLAAQEQRIAQLEAQLVVASITSAAAEAAMLGVAVAPTSGTSTSGGRSTSGAIGAIDVDTNGDVWLCTVAGAPGTWRRLSGGFDRDTVLAAS